MAMSLPVTELDDFNDQQQLGGELNLQLSDTVEISELVSVAADNTHIGHTHDVTTHNTPLHTTAKSATDVGVMGGGFTLLAVLVSPLLSLDHASSSHLWKAPSRASNSRLRCRTPADS